MSTATHPEIDAIRAGLAVIVDALLPGTERLPSGRDVGAHTDLLDRVVSADPKLVAVLVEFGGRAAEREVVSVAELQAWDPESFEVLNFALSAAYYMSRDVHRALDYPGVGPHPIAEATPDQMYSEKLLAPVRSRGSIYVAAPD